jgi:single-stranded DNA-binding protein
MSSVNKAIIMGSMYHVKKVETGSGKSMVMFTVRLHEKFGESERVTFLDCVAYSGIADVLIKYGEDKKQIYLEGRINVYKDRDGATKTNLVVEEFRFIGERVA